MKRIASLVTTVALLVSLSAPVLADEGASPVVTPDFLDLTYIL